MARTQDLMYWNFSVLKCNLYSWASQAIGNWAHCCTQTVTLPYALKGLMPRSHYLGCNQLSMTSCEWVTHDCQMWSDFGYLQISWRDAKSPPPVLSTWVLIILMGDKLQEFGVFAFWHITCDACYYPSNLANSRLIILF